LVSEVRAVADVRELGCSEKGRERGRVEERRGEREREDNE
jgi:hypothetical protein